MLTPMVFNTGLTHLGSETSIYCINLIKLQLKFCSCELMGGVENTTACAWNYSGLGVQYQVLAGAAFIAIFTTAGIFIAMLSDRYNRYDFQFFLID